MTRDPKFQIEHSKRISEIDNKFVDIAENYMRSATQDYIKILLVNNRLNSRAIDCNVAKIVIKEAAALAKVSHPEMKIWLQMVIDDQKIEADYYQKLGWG